MAQYIPVSLDLPSDLLCALGHAAERVRCAPSDYVWRVLAAHVGTTPAGPAASVGEALACASDWLDLQRRLRAGGHVLRQRDGALMLMSWPLERFLVPLAALGHRTEDLVLRFGAPFPTDLPFRQTAPARFRHRAA